jgi:pimeloyl-ACP methyl ester carboxylesterase
VPFRIEVRNKNGNKARHCALFYASSNYGFQSTGYNDLVPASDTALAMDKDADGKQETFGLTSAKTLIAKNESLDILKLFVSNSKINGEGLQQTGFPLGKTVEYPLFRSAMRGEEETIAKAKGISSFGEDGEESEDVNDWYTLTLRVKCVARQAIVGEQPIALANNFIKIHPHPSFRAGVAISSVSTGSRGLEPMAVVAELARRNGLKLLPFGGTTRDIAPINMLELSDLQNEDSLAGQPLQIEIAAQLQESAQHEDLLLPLTFDGEYLIPVGYVQRLENGNALISIEQLPDIQDNRRSVLKAFKLCFLKLVLKKDDVQKLCWVDYSSDVADRRSENPANKVAAANNILLVTHGIIGDTQGMAECMRPAYNDKLFDLVLTFDYENLNTKIEVTAAKLADKLHEAGITPESGKKITILAHSLGGLVTRYFIENMQGNQVVKHLVMAGTPNGGSAIAKVTEYRDYLLPLLTLAINSPWSIPAAATILAIMKGSKIITPTLEQMNYDHPDGFLKNLAKANDPGIRYSIVAGDLQQFLNGNAEQRHLMDKLYGLGGKLFYKDRPNDLAVSVESIKAVPMQRQPVPKAVVVAGNHLNYFVEKGCVAAVMGFMKEKSG